MKSCIRSRMRTHARSLETPNSTPSRRHIRAVAQPARAERRTANRRVDAVVRRRSSPFVARGASDRVVDARRASVARAAPSDDFVQMFRSSEKRRDASTSRGETRVGKRAEGISANAERAGKTPRAMRGEGDDDEDAPRRDRRVLNAREGGNDAHASTSYARDACDERVIDERYVPARYVARYHATPAMEAMLDDEGARRGRPHRDQFLTSAMLCVGAVSVCLVSVMIAGGLAFVGLSESHERGGGMDYVRSGADAWTSAGGYRAGDVERGERLFASQGVNGGRYDYFAQPDRFNQDVLVDELDKRYGARLEALMHAMQNGENGGFTLTSTHRGDDPSYLPPAPMTEIERKLNEKAESERRNVAQHLPAVVSDEYDDDEARDDDDAELERRAYDDALAPHDVVKKARERFEEYENTVEWHEKIREDADNYIERLREIQAILSRGYHKSARKQIELGVEAVRQWRTTIAKDLKTKTSALEFALEKIADAKSNDDSVHVSTLQRDIEDELEALKTSSERVQDLKHAVRGIVDALSSKRGDRSNDDDDDDEHSSHHHHNHAEKDEYDLDPETHDHERAMKHWKNVADEWVDSKTHVSRHAEPLAPWAQAHAALGSAAPAPTSRLNVVLEKLVALVRNVTDDLGEKISDHLTNATASGAKNELTATMSLHFNGTNITSIGDSFNFTVRLNTLNGQKFNTTEMEAETETPDVGAEPRRLFPALGLPAPVKKNLAQLGGSWGPNQWVGTDVEDATWDPIHGDVGDGDDEDVEATATPATSEAESQPSTSTKSGAKEGADEEPAKTSHYKYTPTPDDEDFKSTTKRDATEEFANAEHRSAEAWRAEAIKAQKKLAELASKGITHSNKDVEDEETSEETVKEFKKALVREVDARAKAEKELREFKIRAANEQEETEKRVVEQAKLQILAARAEARDASLARIKAEAEAEKIAKEKSKLAKAAAKVQESAERALESLVKPGASRVVAVSPEVVSESPEVAIEATEDANADEDVIEVTEDASRAASSWDRAEDEVKRAASSSSSSHTFTVTFGIKNTKHLTKSDVETLRDAALSLLDARARGACDDDGVSTRSRPDARSNALEIDVTCDNARQTPRLRAAARDAVNWAFETDRFTRNLRALGFPRADDVYLARVDVDDPDDADDA